MAPHTIAGSHPRRDVHHDAIVLAQRGAQYRFEEDALDAQWDVLRVGQHASVPGSHIVRVRLFWTRTAGPAVGAAIRGSAVSAHPVLGETGSDSWPQRASTPRKSRVEVDSYRFAGRCMLASSLAAAGAPVGPGT